MGNRQGNCNLTNRLTREEIHTIYQMAATGRTKNAIADFYKISTTSVDRVMNQNDWTKGQKEAWDIDTMPEAKWLDETQAVTPYIPRTKSNTADDHKQSEYDAGSTDATRYQKTETQESTDKGVKIIPDSVIADKPSIRQVLQDAEDKRKEWFRVSNQFDNVITALQLVVEEVITLKDMLKQ